MGFWDVVKGIGSVAGVVTGQPWIGPALGAIGGIAGNTEDGRNKARIAETGLNNTEDELALQRALQEQNNSRANLAASNTARKSDEGSAVRGGFLQGVQDAHFNRPVGVPDGGMTGGARPSAILNKESIGKTMQDSANARIAANYPTLNTATPNLTPIPEANGLDKLLNIARGVTGAVSLANQLTAPNGPVQVPTGGSMSIPDGYEDPNVLVNTKLDPLNPLGFAKPKPTFNLGGG